MTPRQVFLPVLVLWGLGWILHATKTTHGFYNMEMSDTVQSEAAELNLQVGKGLLNARSNQGFDPTKTAPELHRVTETSPPTGISSKEPRVAIYMTTHVSDQHREFIAKCWPASVARLPLLQKADLLVYTSSFNKTDEDLFHKIGFRNVTIFHYQVYEFQGGAVQAMVDPFLPQNRHWFQPYDWIVRLNPDVLIRRDEWLRKTFLRPEIDAIFHKEQKRNKPFLVNGTAIYSDFYAFRPKAIDPAAFNRGGWHAEVHLTAGFQEILRNKRWAKIPNVQKDKGWRVAGPKCDIVHIHRLVHYCPNYFDVIHPTIPPQPRKGRQRKTTREDDE